MIAVIRASSTSLMRKKSDVGYDERNQVIKRHFDRKMRSHSTVQQLISEVEEVEEVEQATGHERDHQCALQVKRVKHDARVNRQGCRQGAKMAKARHGR